MSADLRVVAPASQYLYDRSQGFKIPAWRNV